MRLIPISFARSNHPASSVICNIILAETLATLDKDSLERLRVARDRLLEATDPSPSIPEIAREAAV